MICWTGPVIGHKGLNQQKSLHRIYQTFWETSPTHETCRHRGVGCPPKLCLHVIKHPRKTGAKLQTKLVKTAISLSGFIALICSNTFCRGMPLRPPQLFIPTSCSASTNTPKSCLLALKIIGPGLFFDQRGTVFAAMTSPCAPVVQKSEGFLAQSHVFHMCSALAALFEKCKQVFGCIIF